MSNYKYGFKIEEISGNKYILIIDNSCPCHSTEYHMEEVLKEITDDKQIDPFDHIILRKDCNRKWSMWNKYSKDFIALQCTRLYDALVTNIGRDSVID